MSDSSTGEGIGSPPQVRGKPSLVLATCSDIRITPAGAGKTDLRFANLEGAEDHPRRCGENRESLNYATRDIGSPPQVRGKLRAAVATDSANGITPAGAGKTGSGFPQKNRTEDHPRRCGENVFRKVKKLVRTGSPPQVRGKPVRRAGIRLGHGITPAGAGKTLNPWRKLP